MTLFAPVIEAVLAAAAARGGPRRWVETFVPARDGPRLYPLVYRWNRGRDLALLAATLRRVLEAHDGLEPLFASHDRAHDDLGPAMIAAIARLRREALAAAPAFDIDADAYADLPRGFRMFLPTPADGSACKRWAMYLRWMVRSGREGVDLGLWRTLPPSKLVMPMDTHTTRIARLVGLTARTDGSWRTALEVTRALRRFDPDDPIRFDFALAHHGISRACTARPDPNTCPGCALRTCCPHGRGLR